MVATVVAAGLPAGAQASGTTAVKLVLFAPKEVVGGGLATFAGRGTGASGAQIVIQERRGRSWAKVAAGFVGRHGHFALTWVTPRRAAVFIVRVAVLRHGRVRNPSLPQHLRVRAPKSNASTPAISSKVQVISAGTVLAAPSPGSAGHLTYSGGNTVKVGQIIATGEGPATPNGYLGRVTAVTVSGDTETVSTAPALLSQVLSSGSFDAAASTTTTSADRRLASRGVVAHQASVKVQCKGSAQASVTATISVGASIEAKGSFGFFSLRSASVTGEAHASASIDAELGAAGSCTLKKTALVTIPGPKAAFSIGFLPVVLTSEIPVYLDAGATIGAKLSSSIGGGFTAQAGLGWTSGRGFYPIDRFTPSFSFKPPTLTANAELYANLIPTLEVTVDGFAHANLALSAGLALTANTDANPWWTLTAPVELSADLNLGIPGILDLSSPTLDIYKRTFTLATAPLRPNPGPQPGTLSIIAGDGESGEPTPGPATSTDLGLPTDVALDSHGNLYITDLNNEVVEKLTPSDQLSIVAGQVGQSGSPAPGPATSSELDFAGECGGVAVDKSGDLFIADCGNDVVEEVTPSGQLSMIAGQVDQSGSPTPGPATSSDLDDPAGVAVDGHGNVYIADDGNDVIEEVTPSGQLSIIAGQVGQDGEPTPGPATQSDIGVSDIAADSAGDVYIADGDNNVVEEVTPSGELSIKAGQVGQSGTPTPGPATDSELDFGDCGQVAVNSAGSLYVADCSNDAVEEVTPTGQLSVIAGQPGESGAPTPGPATSSDLDGPTGIAVDEAGDVYIADSGNAVVEEVKPAS